MDLVKGKTMKSLQGLVPIILSILFVGFIILGGGWKANQLVGTSLFIPTVLFLVLYVLWLVLESKVASKEIGMSETNVDIGSLEVYALSRATVVIVGVLMMFETQCVWRHYVGLGLFVVAVTFRLIAIRKLGQFYSHRVRIREEHQVINTGPYNYVRHPAYTGMILAHLGFALFFYHPVTLLVWAFFHIPAIVYRILVEEKAIFEIPGYLEYSKTRKRLLPFIW